MFIRCFITLSLSLLSLDASQSCVMRQEIESLGPAKNFAFVDLEISQEEKKLIEQAVVESDGEYNQYGNLQLIEMELPQFLRIIGIQDEQVIEAIVEIICRAAHQVVEASGKETAWVAVRAFLPNERFNTPRWHYDGYFYPPYYPTGEVVYKFAAALKGRQTLLYALPMEMRENFNAYIDDRQFLSEYLRIDLAVSPKQGEGVFFIVGDPNNAAIHSEPPMNEARLFFSILPGSNEDIGALYERWH